MTQSDRPDTSFGVRAQPLAILQLLSGIEPDYIEYKDGEYQISVKTFPWQGGVALQVVRYLDQPNTLIVTWFESHVSDDIIVRHWDTPTNRTRVSGPLIEDQPVWVNTHKFPFGDFGRVVHHITRVIRNFYLESGLGRQERRQA